MKRRKEKEQVKIPLKRMIKIPKYWGTFGKFKQAFSFSFLMGVKNAPPLASCFWLSRMQTGSFVGGGGGMPLPSISTWLQILLNTRQTSYHFFMIFNVYFFRIKPPSNFLLLIYYEIFTSILFKVDSPKVAFFWYHYPGIIKDLLKIPLRPHLVKASPSWKGSKMSTC